MNFLIQAQEAENIFKEQNIKIMNWLKNHPKSSRSCLEEYVIDSEDREDFEKFIKGE